MYTVHKYSTYPYNFSVYTVCAYILYNGKEGHSLVHVGGWTFQSEIDRLDLVGNALWPKTLVSRGQIISTDLPLLIDKHTTIIIMY